MNFTDWQDLWLKKDVEKISKSINTSTDFSLSIIIDLIIATLVCIISAISIIKHDDSLFFLIVTLGVLSVLVPISIFLIFRIRKHCKIINSIEGKRIPVKEYIDIFDNKVCNSAMMADSLFEHMRNETDFPAKYYCICEINYFINKCINALYSMKSRSKEVFVDDKNGCVSPKRLRLVLKLLYTLRVQTYREMESITEKDIIVEKYINDEIKKHDERIVTFINEFNAINPNNSILAEWIVDYEKKSC
jgi:hypothetical protein